MAAYGHLRPSGNEWLRTIGHFHGKELTQTAYRRAGKYRAKVQSAALSQYLGQHRRATRQSRR
jgi:hypothetical protein